MTIAVVMAGGEGTRWGNFMDTPKHLVKVDGEVLLHRTVRMLQERGIETWVICQDDHRYWKHGAKSYVIKPAECDIDKFMSSEPLWLPDEDVIFAYGDVYFTEHCMDTLVAKPDDWVLVGRELGSKITGSEWGECFGFHVTAKSQDWFRHCCGWLEQRWHDGYWRVGGWELYRALRGADLDLHAVGDHFVLVDDESEDFDKPRDYVEWMRRCRGIKL